MRRPATALLLALGGLAPPALASDALTLPLAGGGSAQLSALADGDVLLRWPDGREERLAAVDTDLAEERFGLQQDDFDFDGLADFARVTSVGMVNQAYEVYLQRSDPPRFELLRLPPEAGDNCGLSGLQTEPEQRLLHASCRGGPIWYYDAWRFDAQGAHLDRTLLVEQTQDPRFPDIDFMFYEARFGEDGREILRTAVGFDGEVQHWIVPVARLPLYERADSDSRSRMYLIEGDACEVIAHDGEWLHIRYRNPRRGAIERWVWLPDAYPDAR